MVCDGKEENQVGVASSLRENQEETVRDVLYREHSNEGPATVDAAQDYFEEMASDARRERSDSRVIRSHPPFFLVGVA